MANRKQLARLKKGTVAWNEWRATAKGDEIDLSGSDLNGKNLVLANLSDANLTGSNLFDANLEEADLSRAVLGDVNLSRRQQITVPTELND
jgi:uncharacterized protein YjbI with pentapeptide repeats